MARLLRVQFPGAIYHITARGNARQAVFKDDRDRERFLTRLDESLEAYEVRLYLFCLMTTHFHLVLETPNANLSRFMQSLETGYTVYFNLRHNSVGHVLQGRYGARVVQGDEYLLKLSRYVHLNPVCTPRCERLPLPERKKLLRGYPWSSYPSYIGKTKSLAFVDYGPMLDLVPGRRKRRATAYRAFVEYALAKADDEFEEVLKESRTSIGSEEFQLSIDQMYERMRRQSRRPADIQFRHRRRPIPPDQVLRVLATVLEIDVAEFRQRRRNSMTRPLAAWSLLKYSGLTMRGIAEALGFRQGAAASRHIRHMRGTLANEGPDGRYHQLLGQVASILTPER